MTNSPATAAIIAECADLDGLIERLQALRDNHFDADPETIHYGHVGDVADINARLRAILGRFDGSAE